MTNKPRIIILSDLWGKIDSDWVTNYTVILEKYFEVVYYDCCDLANINNIDCDKDRIHHQFVNGGIDRATQTLFHHEKEAFVVLGFSIGGYIGWNACVSGLKAEHFYGVSATRLRVEDQKPLVNVRLYYGKNDPYNPDHDWFQKMGISSYFFDNEDHEFYQRKELAELICTEIITCIVD